MCVCVLGIVSSVQAQTDDEVLNTCSDIKALARQTMPGWAFQRLEALSESECTELLGGMTYSELKWALANAEYIEDPDAPRTQVTGVTGAFEGTLEEFLQRDESLRRGHPYHLPGTDIHILIGPDQGATRRHIGAPFWMKHRWDDAGRETSHIKLTVELKHHYSHYDAWFNYLMYVDYTPYDEPWYHYYRSVTFDSEEVNYDGDGYRTFEMQVSYEHRKCHEDWWICLPLWQEYSVSSNCYVAVHLAPEDECHVDPGDECHGDND